MNKTKKTIGFALTGSFCTFSKTVPQIEGLSALGYEILPIMSEVAYQTDTRFGSASGFITRIEAVCGHSIIHTIADAEPIGPRALLDALIIAPCTGNTLAKLATGVADSPVTLAAKAHLRNERPLIIAVSSNDALANNAKNIGALLNNKHIYFVPFGQDNPVEKHASAVAHMDLIPETLELALRGEQIQPILR